jgi:cold shock CspA family protein
MDEDNSDIFVHYDDLSKAGITKDFMRSTKHGNIIRFEFSCMVYVGKYNKSRKAVDLMMLSNNYMPF